MMDKAFIFDMDGVLVNSETYWERHDSRLWERFFSEDIRKKLGTPIGLGVRGLYAEATKHGAQLDFEELSREYDKAAIDVYRRAPITEGVEDLAQQLIARGFKLGIVTSSPTLWVEQVVPRLSFKDSIECLIAMGSRMDLRPKPEPDGYIEAMRTLGADAQRSYILEDSNLGIRAGKACGAYVIGLKQNLVPGYDQTGADAYAPTVRDVVDIIDRAAVA